MHYKRIELKVTNQGIHERKIFQGVKIFSRSKLSKDQKSILTQKVYLTPKQNIVYYKNPAALISSRISLSYSLIIFHEEI